MPIADPRSWEVLQFGDETAFVDFLGAHELQHRAFDQQIRQILLLPTYPVLPLGDYTGPEWHDAHQLVHDGEATSLGIAAAPDFRSYDFADPDQWASYHWLHAQEHVRIREAAAL